MSKTFNGDVVRIADLVLTGDKLESYIFRNCQIIGPAIVIPLGSTEITRCRWDGSFESIIWPIDDERQEVVGAIGLQDCILEECRLREIGMAVPRRMMETVRSGFS